MYADVLPTWMSAHPIYTRHPWWPEESSEFFGTGDKDDCELPGEFYGSMAYFVTSAQQIPANKPHYLYK